MERISPRTAEAWAAAGQYFDWNGQRIFYRVDGPADAPPLLLLHGFPTASVDWLPLWADLAKDWRVLAFDYLGFGLSPKPRRHRYSIHEQADIAAALTDERFGRDFHILTHDYGVSVAQELLARSAEGGLPHRALSCVFLNGGLLPEQHRALPIQKLLAGPFGWIFVHLMNRERFMARFAGVFGPDTQPSADELEAFWSMIAASGGNRIQHKLLHYIADRRVHGDRWRAVIADPPCPIGLINGSLDPVSGAHLANAVAALNPAIPVRRLPHIGHYPQTEAPDLVRDAFREFHANPA